MVTLKRGERVTWRGRVNGPGQLVPEDVYEAQIGSKKKGPSKSEVNKKGKVNSSRRKKNG